MYGLQRQYFMLLSFLKSKNCSTDKGSHYLKWFTMCGFLQLQEYVINVIYASWQPYILEAINQTHVSWVSYILLDVMEKRFRILKHSLQLKSCLKMYVAHPKPKQVLFYTYGGTSIFTHS
jgi:hypothetical protein